MGEMTMEKRVADHEKNVTAKTYIVKKGDTLSDIAHKYKITVSKIKTFCVMFPTIQPEEKVIYTF